MVYTPTRGAAAEMLGAMGLSKVADLYEEVPASVLNRRLTCRRPSRSRS